MREQLHQLVGAARRERLEPLRGDLVALGASRARKLAVGNLPNRHVAEGVLRLARDRRGALTLYELLAHEQTHAFLDDQPRERRGRRQGADPEHLADDGRIVHDRLLLGGESVKARRNDPMHRLRQRQLAAPDEVAGAVPVAVAVQQTAVGEHPDVFRGVQRVAARPRQDERLHVGRQGRALEQRAQQLAARVPVERGEGDRGGIPLAAAPAGPPLEQIAARGHQDEHRHVRRPVDELVDEIEQAVVRPVDVLEDERERARLRKRFEPSPPGGERFGAAVAVECILGGEPEQRTEVRRDPMRLVGVGERRPDGPYEAFRDLVRRSLERADLRPRHLGERVEARPFAVGQRVAVQTQQWIGRAVGAGEELDDQAALADPRIADDREQLRRALAAHAFERPT